MVRTSRTSRLPPRTHSGHWKPTGAGTMQSVQIDRSQRAQRKYVSRSACRKHTGGPDTAPAPEVVVGSSSDGIVTVQSPMEASRVGDQPR
jgi:hypothetical protein